MGSIRMLGLKSMKNKRTIIDTVNNRMYFCGEGPIEIRVPPGTDTYQLVQAPSGHLMLPVSDYPQLHKYLANRDRLDQPPESVNLPVMEETATTTSTATSSSTAPTTRTATTSSSSASSSSAPATLPGPLGFPSQSGQRADGRVGFPTETGH